jgi:hypothetical protein
VTDKQLPAGLVTSIDPETDDLRPDFEILGDNEGGVRCRTLVARDRPSAHA